MSARWYCVQTEPFREPDVRERLEDQGFGAFLPQVIQMRAIRPGVTQAKAIAAFPGYLFACFDVAADRWRSIVYTRGVKGLFSSAPERPTPIPQSQMQVLLAQGYDRPIAEDPRPALIEAGAKVRITEGPFMGLDGICLWDDRKRVGLLFDLLGGQQRATVARKKVEAV